jgi:hypothetical protein
MNQDEKFYIQCAIERLQKALKYDHTMQSSAMGTIQDALKVISNVEQNMKSRGVRL